VIWRYEHADFHRASEQLDELDLDSIFSDPSIDVCWDRWKTSFLSVMDTCIPKSMLPERKSVPWMTKAIDRSGNQEEKLLLQEGKTQQPC